MRIGAFLLTLAVGLAGGAWWLMASGTPEFLPPPPLQQPTKTLEHPNGLRLQVPRDLKVSQWDHGFHLGFGLNEVSRGGYGLNGDITVVEGQLNTKGSRQREVAPGIVYYYSVRRHEKDMAQDVFSLNACRQIGARFVCLEQFGATKGAEPHFEIWSLAPGISLK
jgi:hypothetical protein